MKSLRTGLRLYISSLSVTLYLLLLVFLVLILLPYRGQRAVSTDAATIIDVFGLPMIAFFVALDIVRDPLVTTFEVSILSSIRKLFWSRITIYAALIAIPLLLTFLVTITIDKYFYLALLSNFLLYITIVSLASLIDDYKMIIFYLVTFIFIMPYVPLIIINKALMYNTRLGLFLSLFCFYFDPVIGYAYRKVFMTSINILFIISTLFSLLIIFLSYIFFSKKEFNI